MATKAKRSDGAGYAVPEWYWKRFRASAIRSAREWARKRGMTPTGDPQVHVVLAWDDELPESAV